MKTQITNFFQKLLLKESSKTKLIFSFCIGNYVAFSPYPFPLGHTLLAFLLSLLLNLNTGIVLFATFFINNPWTALPIYGSDYLFGRWIVYSLLHLNPTNPSWMTTINHFLERYLGFGHFCLWSFLIGGNLLGIVTSVMLYFILKNIFLQPSQFAVKIDESHCTEQKSPF